MELCKHLASRNFKTVLVISSKLSSTVPLSLRQYPLVEINEISEAPPLEPSSQPLHRHHEHHSQIALGLKKLLSTRNHDQSSVRPLYAVVDMKMSWTFDIFNRYEVPAVSFFTSGACSAAVEYAMWKAHPLDVKAGETRLLPGLPEEMAITVSDLKRSVLYISFGTVVGPSKEEYEMLAEALEASTRSFIWVVRANAGLSTGPSKPSQPDSEPEEAYFP
ncbi:hypothetical protein ACLB2K_045164 [Fragaria x ananassa]